LVNRTDQAAMLHYQTIPVTPFQQNCSLVWEDSTMTAAVIDPGGDLDRLTAAAQALGVRIAQIWLTHAHIDHAGGTAALARELQVPIIGPHPADQFWIDALAEQGQRFGFPHAEVFTPTRWLRDGDTVSVGHCRLDVRHCPGHTPGHVVFHSPEIGRAFVGDVLFQGSIGRTDFPYGDTAALLNAIRTKLFPLGDHIQFLCGHGPASSFGAERQGNPFVGDNAS
jgi:glyoxylase-like metal-dependent hydrolase (beta-lactamase superfamily II)